MAFCDSVPALTCRMPANSESRGLSHVSLEYQKPEIHAKDAVHTSGPTC